MRHVWSILALCLLATLPGVPAFAGNDSTTDAPKVSCSSGVPGGINCIPTKDNLKQARSAYVHGVKLQERKQVFEIQIMSSFTSQTFWPSLKVFCGKLEKNG